MKTVTIANRKKIQLYSILIMTTIALAVAIFGFAYLYKIKLQESQQELQELVKSQARIYEAIAKFDAIVSGTRGSRVSRAGTLSQIKEAHIHYSGFGKTGEIVLAERVADEVVFLLPTRKLNFEIPPPLPLDDSKNNMPMKLALSGTSGTITAIDHSGEEVLAAYEYLPFLEMGLVAQMDLSEIQAPFFHAALYTSIVAWLAILIGAVLNIRLVGPLINSIIQAHKQIKESEARLEDLSNQLSRYLSPQIYQSIFEGKKSARIGSHRKKLTVFLSDIVGFTAMTDSMEPEDLSFHLNAYLNRMSEVVIKHGGTLDKFIGDAVLVFFGDPETEGPGKDAERCVAMAMDMREAIGELKKEWKLRGISHDFSVRMGIASGFCTVGNFGSEQRMEYTIIGNTVNLASRLESAAQPGEILISADTGTLVEKTFLLEEVAAIQVKGFAREVTPCRVLGHRQTGTSEPDMQYLEPGFELNINLNEVPADQQDELLLKLKHAISMIEDQKKSEE